MDECDRVFVLCANCAVLCYGYYTSKILSVKGLLNNKEAQICFDLQRLLSVLYCRE